MTYCLQVQLRRQKCKDVASGESSEMTSPSPMSSELHELTSSPVSSDFQDSEDEQPQTIDSDIFLKPSSYVLPCDAITGDAIAVLPSVDDEPTVAYNCMNGDLH